jgi:LAS superfamily LD-carboxypeptidase LdcB
MKMSHDISLYIIGIIAVVGIGVSAYYILETQEKQDTVDTLLQERNALLQMNNQKMAELQVAETTITELQSDLTEIKYELDDLADAYQNERNRNEDFEDQIRSLAGTLGTLDKLAKTDKELLAKYSKVYFLNENYTPERLVQIDDKYVLAGKKDQYFHGSAIKHLNNLLAAAVRAGIDLKIVSAYRSFDEQNDIKGQFTQVYGSGANTFSADQGYSEHQLGTTVDFTTPEVGGTFQSFAQTEAYDWLLQNAYRYGFILSYPENNNFYIFEPWHWRFVGTELARHLDRTDETFYTMEQREIDEYLVNLFD